MANDIANNVVEQRAQIAKICEVAGAPGLAIGVLQNDRIVFEDFHGYRDVELGLKPNEDTIFFVASLTKAITAAAIGLLLDDGSMDWTTPVHDILPELSRPSPLSDAKLNVLDVLSHQTGITWADALYLQSNNNILLPKSECIRIINYLPVVKPPRSAFIYNNHVYNIAGLIVERLSGMNYGEFVHQRIFSPLGMDRTFTKQPEDPNVALPYNILLDKTPFRIPFSEASNKSMMFAGQSVRSSLKDLLRLYEEYLRSMRGLDARERGIGRSQTRSMDGAFGAVTEPSPFKQMATIVTPRISRVDGLLEQTYALGWNRTQLPGKLDFGWNSGLVKSLPIVGQRAPSTLALWHGGNMPGTTVAVCLLPEPGIAIAVLQNSLGLCDAADWICQLIVETVLAGTPGHDYVALAAESVAKGGARMKEVAERLEEERIPATKPRPLDSYTGFYYNAIRNWVIEVGLSDVELYLQFQGRANERFVLRHYHYDTFVWNLGYDDTVMRAQYCRPYAYYKMVFESQNMGKQSAKDPIVSIRWRHDQLVPQGEIFCKKICSSGTDESDS